MSLNKINIIYYTILYYSIFPVTNKIKFVYIGYPKEVLNLKYDQTNCRRGCMIDKKRGNIIKLDRHKYVRQAFHGITSLSDELRKSLYRW